MASMTKVGGALGASLLLLAGCSVPSPSSTAYFSEPGGIDHTLGGRSDRQETTGARLTASPVIVSDASSDQAEDSDLPAGEDKGTDDGPTDHASGDASSDEDPLMGDPAEEDSLADGPGDLGQERHEPSDGTAGEPAEEVTVDVADEVIDEADAGSQPQRSGEAGADLEDPEVAT